MGFQVENIDFAFRNIKNDHLFLVDHPKEVDDVFVLTLPENFSIGVQVDDAFLLSWPVNSYQYEGLLVGYGCTEDLWENWV